MSHLYLHITGECLKYNFPDEPAQMKLAIIGRPFYSHHMLHQGGSGSRGECTAPSPQKPLLSTLVSAPASHFSSLRVLVIIHSIRDPLHVCCQSSIIDGLAITAWMCLGFVRVAVSGGVLQRRRVQTLQQEHPSFTASVLGVWSAPRPHRHLLPRL